MTTETTIDAAPPATITLTAEQKFERLAADPAAQLMMLLWLNRHQQPELCAIVREADIDAFQASVDYTKQHPQVLALPRKDYVAVVLVDQYGGAVRPCESNEVDFAKAQAGAKARQAREQIDRLAEMVAGQARAGDFSSSTIIDLCEAARAVSAMVPR